MIRVLIVEDSAVAREFLIHIISSDPSLTISGTAANGKEAVEAVARKKPDVVTMDIHMPVMDGLAATRKIMETHPVPIVIVSSSLDPHEVAVTFEAIRAGALAFVARPTGIGHPSHQMLVRELLQTIKLMSEVKVVRRYPRDGTTEMPRPAKQPPRLQGSSVGAGTRLIAIGASTGGPVAIQTILSLLSKKLPVPVVIVQHMAAGFIQGYVDWLAQTTGQKVKVAEAGERLDPGIFYVAPDGSHLIVGPGNLSLLAPDPTEDCIRPSVSHLFRSALETYENTVVGVLLSGMGTDGAEELSRMRALGAVTIAQDEASSVVHGMPGEAIRLGAAQHVLPPEGIAAILGRLTEIGG